MAVRSTLRRVAVIVGLGFCASAGAGQIQFSFTGQATEEAINGCDVVDLCKEVSGHFTFDSAAVDDNPALTLGLYTAGAISLSIDGAEFFSALSSRINVVNFASLDQYGLLAIGMAGTNAAELSILLEDASALAFDSDALPLAPSVFASMLPRTFTLFGTDEEGNDAFQLRGTIGSITCTQGCDSGGGGGQVPEPAGALLVALGLAASGVVRKRSRS